VQEALIAAAAHWPRDGIPESPRGWLLQTAERRMVDAWRSERSRRQREEVAAQEPAAPEVSAEDDTLAVLFMCCHPALTDASAIALTLRAVGGLTTSEIASAFLVDEAAMAQRIGRAKQRIRASGVPFRMPEPNERRARVSQVLRVLYLIFNEGYASSSGIELQRAELSEEAIRLARMVQRLLPDDGEVTGLLALMLLIDARRPARTDAAGELVPLGEQDRSCWNRGRIAEGTALLNSALGTKPLGEYRIQAAIAAIHDRAETAEETDWPQIVALYDQLLAVAPTPVVALNRAIAIGELQGPAAALPLVEELDLDHYYPFHATRADLLWRLGRHREAAAAYQRAAAMAPTEAERDFLRIGGRASREATQ
jgi:predicted RNA polymerase sigma factor